jgi:uncharacterized protein HemX
MTGGAQLLAILGALGGGTGVVALILLWPQIRKLRSETRKVDVDAALAVDSAEDEHLTRIIQQQAEYLIEPLKAEVKELRAEVGRLRAEMSTLLSKYRSALDWIRAVLALARTHHPDEALLPPVPAEVADDL